MSPPADVLRHLLAGGVVSSGSLGHLRYRGGQLQRRVVVVERHNPEAVPVATWVSGERVGLGQLLRDMDTCTPADVA